MYPFIPEAPIWAKVFFSLAIFGFGTAIALGLYWLITGSKETTATDIKAIRNLLEEERQQRQNIQVVLGVLDWLIGKFKKKG